MHIQLWFGGSSPSDHIYKWVCPACHKYVGWVGQCMPLFITWVSACADRLNFETRLNPLKMAMLGTPGVVYPHWDQFCLALLQPGLHIEDPGSSTIRKVSLQSVLGPYHPSAETEELWRELPASVLSLFALGCSWVCVHLSKMLSATFCFPGVTWCWRTRKGHFQTS